MPSVAEQLLIAREKRNLTVPQVASLTNIKSEHIKALEEGNYDIFSAPIYIRGFVRSISKILKMDQHAVMAELDLELAATENFSEPPSLAGRKKGFLDHVLFLISKVQWKLVGPILLVLVVIWIASAVMKSEPSAESVEPPPVNVGPGLYDDKSGGGSLPLPDAE
jgi:cytoskeleton protein RodZ